MGTKLKLKAKIIERYGTQADFAQAIDTDESLISGSCADGVTWINPPKRLGRKRSALLREICSERRDDAWIHRKPKSGATQWRRLQHTSGSAGRRFITKSRVGHSRSSPGAGDGSRSSARRI